MYSTERGSVPTIPKSDWRRIAEAHNFLGVITDHSPKVELFAVAPQHYDTIRAQLWRVVLPKYSQGTYYYLHFGSQSFSKAIIVSNKWTNCSDIPKCSNKGMSLTMKCPFISWNLGGVDSLPIWIKPAPRVGVGLSLTEISQFNRIKSRFNRLSVWSRRIS